MFRAIIELLLVIGFVLFARFVFTHLLRSIAIASRNAYQQTMEEAERRKGTAEAHSTGQLHKDPVCGTYVAESTPYRLQISGDTFYYCSDACRRTHIPVAH